MSTPHTDLTTLFERRSEAMRTKDIDRLMSLYSPDVVYFDLVPPLQYAGSTALRERFSEWFTGWDGPIGMETRDLSIVVSGDIAIAHWFSRASGTLKNEHEVGFWVRVTSCCLRSTDRWLITHEHVSLPIDPKSRSAVMDLVP